MPMPHTIPVALDSTPLGSDPEGLVRMVYFRFEADDPSTTLFLQTGGLSFPFILLGLEGIVLSPNANQEQFSSLSDLKGLIEAVEALGSSSEDASLMFGTGSIWVPLSSLVTGKRMVESERQVERGDIFRLSAAAFRQAWLFLEGQIDESSLRSWFSGQLALNSESRAVSFSSLETKVFREWSEENLGDEERPTAMTR